MASVPTAAINRYICLLLMVLYLVSLALCVGIPIRRDHHEQGTANQALVLYPEPEDILVGN